MALAAAAFFVSSAARHASFNSNLYDLGIFDQAVYLISQGRPPIVTTLNFHILGDHAAFILYPIALLYRLHPDVHWLFAIQALALASTAIPVHALSKALDPMWRLVVAIGALLYPGLYNAALFDFHPETIAVPALYWAIWAGLERRTLLLIATATLACLCKEILGLTVLFLGLTLWLEGRKSQGAIAALVGTGWILLDVFFIIPIFSGAPPAALSRYSDGSAMLARLASPQALGYFVLLTLPFLPALNPRKVLIALPALPLLALNLLSTSDAQRDLVHQYTLPILPFLVAWQIRSLEARPLNLRWLVVWPAVAFLALAKYGYFFSLFNENRDTRPAIAEAIRKIPPEAGVLTTSPIAPHLTHRKTIDFRGDPVLFDAILIDMRHPGWGATPVKMPPDGHRQVFQNDGVYLYLK